MARARHGRGKFAARQPVGHLARLAARPQRRGGRGRLGLAALPVLRTERGPVVAAVRQPRRHAILQPRLVRLGLHARGQPRVDGALPPNDPVHVRQPLGEVGPVRQRLRHERRRVHRRVARLDAHEAHGRHAVPVAPAAVAGPRVVVGRHGRARAQVPEHPGRRAGLVEHARLPRQRGERPGTATPRPGPSRPRRRGGRAPTRTSPAPSWPRARCLRRRTWARARASSMRWQGAPGQGERRTTRHGTGVITRRGRRNQFATPRAHARPPAGLLRRPRRRAPEGHHLGRPRRSRRVRPGLDAGVEPGAVRHRACRARPTRSRASSSSARAHGVAIVPSGGRTGLAGGAMAANGELVVSLSRMRADGRRRPARGPRCACRPAR